MPEFILILKLMMVEKDNHLALRLGFDVGSTTLKTVVVDAHGEVVYSRYERHHADIEGA